LNCSIGSNFNIRGDTRPLKAIVENKPEPDPQPEGKKPEAEGAPQVGPEWA